MLLSCIAIPTDTLLPSVQRQKKYYFTVGEMARLDCKIAPSRALVHQYAVTWLKGDRILYQQALPNMPENTSVSMDPRYSLDPTTLSLLIYPVKFTDGSPNYHCQLRVQDPNTMETFLYRVTRNLNISLEVFGKQ